MNLMCLKVLAYAAASLACCSGCGLNPDPARCAATRAVSPRTTASQIHCCARPCGPVCGLGGSLGVCVSHWLRTPPHCWHTSLPAKFCVKPHREQVHETLKSFQFVTRRSCEDIYSKMSQSIQHRHQKLADPSAREQKNERPPTLIRSVQAAQ